MPLTDFTPSPPTTDDALALVEVLEKNLAMSEPVSRSAHSASRSVEQLTAALAGVRSRVEQIDKERRKAQAEVARLSKALGRARDAERLVEIRRVLRGLDEATAKAATAALIAKAKGGKPV